MTDTQLPTALKDFEDKLDQLIDSYKTVKTENNTLKINQENLLQEKAHLLDQASQARVRVEAMISRLKAMEYSA